MEVFFYGSIFALFFVGTDHELVGKMRKKWEWRGKWVKFGENVRESGEKIEKKNNRVEKRGKSIREKVRKK